MFEVWEIKANSLMMQIEKTKRYSNQNVLNEMSKQANQNNKRRTVYLTSEYISDRTFYFINKYIDKFKGKYMDNFNLSILQV